MVLWRWTVMPQLGQLPAEVLGVGVQDIPQQKLGAYVDGSGIESPVEGKGFSARGRMITAFQAIEIYDPAGMHIASLSAGSSADLPAAGIYIVRITEGAR